MNQSVCEEERRRESVEDDAALNHTLSIYQLTKKSQSNQAQCVKRRDNQMLAIHLRKQAFLLNAAKFFTWTASVTISQLILAVSWIQLPNGTINWMVNSSVSTTNSISRVYSQCIKRTVKYIKKKRNHIIFLFFNIMVPILTRFRCESIKHITFSLKHIIQ